MLFLKFNGDEYKVVFRHSSPSADCKQVLRGKQKDPNDPKRMIDRWVCEWIPREKRDPRYTDCTIYKNGRVIATSFAQCSPMDNFSRHVGRVKSLTETMAIAFPELPATLENKQPNPDYMTADEIRALRKAIWDAYGQKCKKTINWDKPKGIIP